MNQQSRLPKEWRQIQGDLPDATHPGTVTLRDKIEVALSLFPGTEVTISLTSLEEELVAMSLAEPRRHTKWT